LIISQKKINLNNIIYEISNKNEIKNLINPTNLLNNGLSEQEKNYLSQLIKEEFSNYINKFFIIDNNIDIDFEFLNINKEKIIKDLISNSKNEKINEEDLIKVVDKNINSFYENLKKTFQRYLESNYLTQFLKISNPLRQKFIFSFNFGIIFAILGFFIFNVYIYKNLSEMNIKNLRIELPNWIQIFTNSMQAGLSLEQSLDFTTDKIKKDPLKTIIKNVTAKYKTFRDLTKALEPFEKWQDKIPEVKLLVSSLKIHQEKGGNIIPILYSLNRLILKRDAFIQKIESITSESMGQLKIIFILFFGIILFSEKMFNGSPGFFSPLFSFCNNGGGLFGSINVFILHFSMFLLSYLLLLGGSTIIKREIKF
ncbi:MAG: type II secretion system F family protein, partial [Caldisericia bacterium]